MNISGGGGSGATAAATIDANGNLTGITITNPGVGYTSAPTLSLSGGGGVGSISRAAGLAANVCGGLTKVGGGTLILSGANTFSGVTTVSNGTLDLTGGLALQDSAWRSGRASSSIPRFRRTPSPSAA